MLAYVFWHWSRRSVTAADYEQLQGAFHEALHDAPPPGFRGSGVFALRGLDWAAGGSDAYEDWYFTDGSAALDPLNDAAVNAGCKIPHDRAAAAAAGGAAGLYRLRDGGIVAEPRHAYWFAKPDGMPYAELFAALRPLCEGGRAALWSRQMVLGPSPEFCLQGGEPLAVPPRIPALRVALRRVWPAP